MNSIQIAILILGAVALIAIYWSSRPKTIKPKKAPQTDKGDAPDQMDLWNKQSSSESSGNAEAIKGSFDKFGVGEPRKRSAAESIAILTDTEYSGDEDALRVKTRSKPVVQMDIEDAVSSKPAPASTPAPKVSSPTIETKPVSKAEPTVVVKEKPQVTVKAEPEESAEPVKEKLVTLYIFEREGTHIMGENIHVALKNEGLIFGDHKIYHRVHGGKYVFGVASILKPGFLDPAESKTFSTPGLAAYLMLTPRTDKPVALFDDFLRTVSNLAEELNGRVCDTARKPLNEKTAIALRTDVVLWAKQLA